ncbi:hypothetical protein FOBRF1_007242 [Fusarium oxysporum]
MPRPPLSNTAVGSTPSTADDSARPLRPPVLPSIAIPVPANTANWKAPANFPRRKTDKPRPHVCGTCQRSFARLGHLKRHELTHTKEKPFQCPECTRCFPRRDLLLRHQQKLHQTSIPSSRSRSRRDSATSGAPGQSRARKNSFAGPNPAASNALASSMRPLRPRANTITHVDGSAVQMIAAKASVARGIPPTHTHSRHPSLAGSPIHSSDHVFGGISPDIGQRGVQHGLPKLETRTLDGPEFSNVLRSAPPIAAFNADLYFEGLFFGPGSTINSNAVHYNDSPQSMALEQAALFAPSRNVMPLGQTHDSFEWLTGFEHQMPFLKNENVADGSSPSAFSTTSQSGINDVMLDGSSHPAPVGASTMWEPSVISPSEMPNRFAMDLNCSVSPDLLNMTPLSHQPASQKIDDPYFSASPSSQLIDPVRRQLLGFNALPKTPSFLHG